MSDCVWQVSIPKPPAQVFPHSETGCCSVVCKNTGTGLFVPMQRASAASGFNYTQPLFCFVSEESELLCFPLVNEPVSLSLRHSFQKVLNCEWWRKYCVVYLSKYLSLYVQFSPVVPSLRVMRRLMAEDRLFLFFYIFFFWWEHWRILLLWNLSVDMKDTPNFSVRGHSQIKLGNTGLIFNNVDLNTEILIWKVTIVVNNKYFAQFLKWLSYYIEIKVKISVR